MQSLRLQLRDKRYALNECHSESEFLEHVAQERRQIDCLVFQHHSDLSRLLKQLKTRLIFLPVVVLESETTAMVEPEVVVELLYHRAVVLVAASEADPIEHYIDRAIDNFLNLTLLDSSSEPYSSASPVKALTSHNSLMLQQRRLAEKLKERLDYLGVYYKRNRQNFFRHMTSEQRQELLQQLKNDYREIVLRYFSNDSSLNERIDHFVNLAFFSDISVPQIVEIHMELIDDFSKQLKLEGRSDEVLLDYRLTLIDTLAHLCEMYRRSIPRES